MRPCDRLRDALGCVLTYGFVVLSIVLRRPMFAGVKGHGR